jgi:sorbitol-specific phosphotransferase system component IIC
MINFYLNNPGSITIGFVTPEEKKPDKTKAAKNMLA